MTTSTELWIIAFSGVAVVVALAGLGWRRRRARPDLGVVSEQWMAQHRTSPHDPAH